MAFHRDIRLRGFYTRRNLAKRTPAEFEALYRYVGDLIASGALPTRIAGTLPLSRVREACAAAAETGDRRPGKLVLVPG
jgi:NADPH:quinone reductase-like Zn-dependent oxidoreductase